MKWQEVIATQPGTTVRAVILSDPVEYAVMEAYPAGTYAVFNGFDNSIIEEKITPARVDELLQERKINNLGWRAWQGHEKFAYEVQV